MDFTVDTSRTSDGGYRVVISLAHVEVYEETFDQYEPGGEPAVERYTTERFVRKLAASLAKEDVY